MRVVTLVPHAARRRAHRRVAMSARMAGTVGVLVIALAALAATAWAYMRGAGSYVDNGDGYYLYAANRLAQGAVLYRDVMGTQPPLVYLLGALLFKLGASLTAVRLVSAALRTLTAALVYLVGRRLYVEPVTAALATLVYVLLPIGAYWDRSFDVNPPLTLLALLSVLPLLRLTPRSARVGGLIAALALFTKDLYLPLLAATLAYLALYQRRLLACYLQGLLASLAVLGALLLAYAGPSGLHAAFLGQESSPANLLWFVAAVDYVLLSEGGIVLVAIVGAILCCRPLRGSSEATADGRADGARAYASWLLAGSCGVLLATLKEGTAGTVFQIAEPAVALLAAHGAVWAWRQRERTRGRAVSLALPALLLVSGLLAAQADSAALAGTNATEVARVADLVRARASHGAVIVAPPYYALITGTRLPGGASLGEAGDTYIVAQRVRRGEPAATAWARTVATGISDRRYPVVLVDLRLAAIAPLVAALRAHYQPIYSDTLPPALHVVVWAPRR